MLSRLDWRVRENSNMAYSLQGLNNYISSEKYIQHNPEVPDGLKHFKPLVLAQDRPLIYEEVVLLVGQGNFVATLCKASWEGQLFAQVDIFRIENGKICLHSQFVGTALDSSLY